MTEPLLCLCVLCAWTWVAAWTVSDARTDGVDPDRDLGVPGAVTRTGAATVTVTCASTVTWAVTRVVTRVCVGTSARHHDICRNPFPRRQDACLF